MASLLMEAAMISDGCLKAMLRYNADRSIEWLSALMMLNWAFVLSLPGDTLRASASYAAFAPHGVNEERLAVVLGIIGAVRVVTLWINGRWPRGPALRILGCVTGAILWSQIAWLLALAASASGALSTGVGAYALLAGAEVLSIYKAAFDARYERGA